MKGGITTIDQVDHREGSVRAGRGPCRVELEAMEWKAMAAMGMEAMKSQALPLALVALVKTE